MEEDIKIVKELIENKYGELLNCWDYGEEAQKSLNNILNELERLQKENEKLKLINQSLENTKDTCPNMATSGIRCNLKNSIPKQVIRDKIQEYKNKIYKLESKKMWNEPIDTINKNRYVNYINILKELLNEVN